MNNDKKPPEEASDPLAHWSRTERMSLVDYFDHLERAAFRRALEQRPSFQSQRGEG